MVSNLHRLTQLVKELDDSKELHEDREVKQLVNELAVDIATISIFTLRKHLSAQGHFVSYLLSDDAGSPVVNGVWEEMLHFHIYNLMDELVHAVVNSMRVEGRSKRPGESPDALYSVVVGLIMDNFESMVDFAPGPSQQNGLRELAQGIQAVLSSEVRWLNQDG